MMGETLILGITERSSQEKSFFFVFAIFIELLVCFFPFWHSLTLFSSSMHMPGCICVLCFYSTCTQFTCFHGAKLWRIRIHLFDKFGGATGFLIVMEAFVG